MDKIGEPGIGIVDDDEVGLPVFQQIHTADGGGVGHFDMDVRVLPVETAQIGNEKMPADGIAGTDAQLSAA